MIKALYIFMILSIAKPMVYAQRSQKIDQFVSANKQKNDLYWIDDTDTLLQHLSLDRSSKKIAAYVNVHDDAIAFYRHENGKMKPIGSFKITLKGLVGELRLEDLNGDGVKEMLLCTAANMNGNRWIQVFIYNKEKDKIEQAGNICTNYTVNKTNKTVEVYYTGSWYMDVYKEIYKWYGYRLVSEKKVVLSIVDPNVSDSMYILVYGNPTQGKAQLKLLSRDVYNERNPRHIDLWKHFFEKTSAKKH